jgi:diguanylate cyclase (GGDEF)-like protein/PAS domain S-box-containing protein
MSDPPTAASAAAPPPWWLRLHRWLLPDYNHAATLYWWAVVLAGAAGIGLSLLQVLQLPAAALAQVAVGVGLAVLAGLVPVRIPGTRNSFSAGEIFIFLLLLMHGPAAGVLAASAETGVGAWRTSARWSSRIASPAISALAMGSAGWLLHQVLATMTLQGLDNAGLLLAAALLFAPLYFVLNALLASTLPRLKRGERPQLSDLIAVFGWIGVAYAGSAAMAVLLVLAYRQNGLGVLLAMLPVLAAMLLALHVVSRQQEAAEAARRLAAEATAREDELAARHMRELQASERRFHSAFTHASIGMALLSYDGRLLQANAALLALLARSPAQLLGSDFGALLLDDDRAALQAQLGRADGAGFNGFALELRCHAGDGSVRWLAVNVSSFADSDTATPCLILQAQDITARRRAEESLHHLAFHDSLTGLPNRRRFHELLAHAVTQAQADPRATYAVMFLDFDRFKLINDSLGHDAGDAFLVQVAQRIRQHLRPADVVARLGGDEFAVLVQPLDHEQAAVALAERIMTALRRPYQVAGTELSTSASIGITFSALGYARPEDVLRDADTAMYKAKGAGKDRWELFDASLHTEVARRLRLEGELRHAIDQGRLALEYQPLFDLRSGAVTGFEALARWPHPVDGSIAPAAFLPIAEEAGLMLRLTDFVLHCACHQLRSWQLAGDADATATISVNISGADIAQPSFVARVTRAIVESGLQPAQLCLELTEDILSSRLEAALPMLHELRRLGVQLAIDDFGTGYSSLSHLSTLPIDTLKIDRSFVQRLGSPGAEASVVQAIVLLGHSLGRRVVAEGIETAAQRDHLLALGCPGGQGFLLGRPADAQSLCLQLRKGPAPPVAAGARTATHATLLH